VTTRVDERDGALRETAEAPRGHSPRWHPRGFNNHLVFWLTRRGVAGMPAWMTYRLGRLVTWMAYHLQKAGTRALIANFGGAFPEKTDRQLRDLALLTYRSYGRDTIDFMRSLSMTAGETRALVGRLDTAAFDQALAEGHGAIAVAGHFGNWELGGVLLTRLTSHPLSVVAMREPSDSVTQMRQSMRASLGIETIEVRQHLDTALQIRRRLQDNRVVAMLVDRHVGKDRVAVSFFGRQAFFLRTPALMAYFSGAPLVPCFVFRDGDKLVIESGPTIRVATDGDRDASLQAATQQVANIIEAQIRRRPEYWYQFYSFWSAQAAVEVEAVFPLPAPRVEQEISERRG
jgi:lauroyl/myristoyl acyltransferase